MEIQIEYKHIIKINMNLTMEIYYNLAIQNVLVVPTVRTHFRGFFGNWI